MPLMRFAVRNEYGLGVPELYKDAVQAEDPKAVLEGVNVAGLVGILRQLGDLAEFAAEVFHGLQEQLASTAARSRKLGTRVQRIEASLPQLEKAILSQTSHIHFAYTPGTEWHARIRNKQNHFIYDDLPHFIMDSYEECREPPRLHLLDRFDAGGPGSCLKRYSDPTFFRRASASSEVANGEKSQREKKARKSKRRRSWQRSGRFSNYTPSVSGRMPLSSTGQRQSILSHAGSTFDMGFTSGKGNQSDSPCSKDGMDFVECVFYPSTSIPPNYAEAMESSAGRGEKMLDVNELIYQDEHSAVSGTCGPVKETSVPRSSSPSWDEKLELLEPVVMKHKIDDIQNVPKTNFNPDEHDSTLTNVESRNQVDDLSDYGSTPRSIVSGHGSKANIGDNQDVSKANFDLDGTVMRPIDVEKVNEADDLYEHGSIPESNVGHYQNTIIDGKFVEPTRLNCVVDDIHDVLHRNFEPHDHRFEPVYVACLNQVPELSEAKDTLESIAKGELLNSPTDRELGRDGVQSVLDTNFDVAEQDMEAIDTEHVSQVDAFPNSENTVTVIDWPQFDDESETDNFVDALNTIESESESDFEGQTKKVVELCSTSRREGEDAIINEKKAQMIGDEESEDECSSELNDHKEEMTDDLQLSQALVPSTGIESLEHAQASCNESAAEGWKLDDSAWLVDDSQHLTTSLSSAIILSLEHAQSCCNELAVVQGKKLDDSPCLLEDQFMQSNESSASMESLEHAQSSFNEPAAESWKLDDSVCMPGSSQCSTASLSSATVGFLEHIQSSGGELAIVQGQKLEDSTCLIDEQSLDHTQSSFSESAVEGQKLDDSARLFDESHCSTASLSSATAVPPEPAQSSSNDLAAIQGQKLDDSTRLLDGQSMTSNKSSSDDYESLEHAESSCNESAGECQKLDQPVRWFDDMQCSTTAVPSVTEVSQVHAQLSCSESAAVQGQKFDDSTGLFDEHLLECPTSSSAPNVSEGIDFSNHKPVVCEIAASSAPLPPNEGTGPTSYHPREIPLGFSSTTPLAFWTNGNLLGLAPSKPTVFSASSSFDSAPVDSGSDITACQFNPNIVQKVNGSTGNQASSVKDSECSHRTKEAKINIGDQDCGSPKYKSYQISDKKHGRSLDQDCINSTDHSLSQGLTNGHTTPHEIKAPSSAGVKNISTETTNKGDDSSSLLSFLGRGLLKNGLRRTGSLGYDEKPKTIKPLSNAFENGCHASISHAAPGTNLERESNSPVNSPPPSPPLEHMRISFRPFDGFDSSRLKLKYPEGVDPHESTIDIFPSFQLVPEPSNLKHDIGSDSDDDTFCRSYACMSDDFLNQLSDSNSEEWESEDSSESNSHGVYGSFQRISSTQSASSSPHCEEATFGSMQIGSRYGDAITLESSPPFDLPVLDTKNPFPCREVKPSLLGKVDSAHFQEQIPQTPPLPPVQWRGARSRLDAAEINQDPRPDSLTQSFDQKLVEMDSTKVPRSEDSATITKTEKFDDQKLDHQQQNRQAENGRKADERGGFLDQIRAKSVSLRHVETSRSAYEPGTAASNKVTAILQKANAIRKAVVSDDGEDDSWSDT